MRQKDFLFYKGFKTVLRPTQTPIQWTAGFSLVTKRPENKADNFTVSSTESKNEMSYTYPPRKCLQSAVLNLLQPTGYVMHHQFNIQKLYALPTLYLCVLYLSENKQRLVPLTA